VPLNNRRFERYAKIRPHFENAGVVSFSVTDIKPNSIFRKLGLKEGDIVTSLDGKRFRRTDEVLNYYKNLPPSARMTLQLIRNSKQKTLRFDFK
jgi:general secretion pathway protein C